MNRNYQRSSNRERQVKLQLEKEGWLAVRTAGSHGVADVIAIRPAPTRGCSKADHFIVRFIQIKVSENIRQEKQVVTATETACGFVNVEFQHYPVKTKKYYEHNRTKRRIQEKKSLGRQQSRSRLRKRTTQ